MIDKNTLKNIIKNHQTLLEKDLGITRELAIPLQAGRATIISGIRRCGKNTLARQTLKGKKPIYYMNFEDISLAQFELTDFTTLQEAFKEELGTQGIYFFDEIQNIGEWERYARQLTDHQEQVLITGSNASMLSRELGTRLTGRHTTKELYPFTYNEYLTLTTQENTKESFEAYLKEGGFPEFLKTKDPEVIKNLFNDILYRDVLQRNELRKEKAIKTLAQHLIANIGKPASYNKLKTLIGAGSGNSISQYIHHLEEAYLLFAINKYDYSLRKQLVNPKKIYCIDNAIITQHAFGFSENKGRLLENAIFLELKRRNEEIYYHQENNECDFITTTGNQVTQAIQVCFKLDNHNMKREIAGLVEALKKYKLKEGLILTNNDEGKYEMEGKTIHVMPARTWFSNNTP